MPDHHVTFDVVLSFSPKSASGKITAKLPVTAIVLPVCVQRVFFVVTLLATGTLETS